MCSKQCNTCKGWVHKRCSGIVGKLKDGDFTCPTCIHGTPGGPVRSELLLGQDGALEIVNKFCYLGDMLAAGGGAEEASRTRVRCAWANSEKRHRSSH